MKRFQKFAIPVVLLGSMILPHTLVRAEPAKSEAMAEPARTKTSKHLRLCAMLGLQEGRTYQFLISNHDDVHFWTIRSLGANGWILAKDSRFPATWVNLSQVIAVTPADLNPAAEREKKPNRAR